MYRLDFYRGDQSKNLIRFMKENGVEWNATAVETYKANAENPIMGVYKNMNLYTSGAPTSGPQLIAMLNILRGFQSNPRDQFTLSHIHQVIETMRVTQSQLAGMLICSFFSQDCMLMLIVAVIC